MDKITISLSDDAEAWLHEQAGENIDAYVEELISKDQARKAAEVELRAMLDDAEESGVADRSAVDIWAAAYSGRQV